MKEFDNLLKQAIQNDKLPFDANPAIEIRLQNRFALNAKKHRLFSNSFAGIFQLLFSPNYIGYKAAFVAVVISCGIWFHHSENLTSVTQTTDTVAIYNHSVFDTTSTQAVDSICR